MNISTFFALRSIVTKTIIITSICSNSLILGQYLTESDRLLQSFCVPVVFTQSGMHTFLTTIFNRPEYAREFLPHSLSHCIQFLKYGKSAPDGLIYLQASCRLFTNKLKASPYLSADALTIFLEQLPPLVQHHCTKRKETWLSELKSTFKSLLYKSFLQNFGFFKSDPDGFFDEVTNQMMQTMSSHARYDEPVTQEMLRNQILRFIELAFTKVIWTPFEYDEAWTSFKTLSSHLVKLYEHSLINYEEMNDLSYSLMERFLYFLDLTGSELSLNLVDTMKADLAAGIVPLCHIEEQEECLETKVSRLRTGIMETEAKILARQRGIITEVLPVSS